jgi:SAM-dependent methyltransferase
MCHISCIVFGTINLKESEVINRTLLDVGSYNSNGSLRSIYESYKPSEYIGVDIVGGPGVDVICNAECLLEYFSNKNFDIIVSTELLEHVRDWQAVISNLKALCKPGGIILITTRSYGFSYHAFPYDFWRYEFDDMKNIFSDCEILALENDANSPGVFIKIRKPILFQEVDLSSYQLFNIVANKRLTKFEDRYFKNRYFRLLLMRYKLYQFAKSLLSNIGIFNNVAEIFRKTS